MATWCSTGRTVAARRAPCSADAVRRGDRRSARTSESATSPDNGTALHSTVSEAAMSADGYFIIAREIGTGVVFTGETTYPQQHDARHCPRHVRTEPHADSCDCQWRYLTRFWRRSMMAALDARGLGQYFACQLPRASLCRRRWAATPTPGCHGPWCSVTTASTVFFTSFERRTSYRRLRQRIARCTVRPNVATCRARTCTAIASARRAANFGPSYFTPRTPTRVLDTRNRTSATREHDRHRATSIVVPVRELHGVPLEASAVAVQITDRSRRRRQSATSSAFPTSSSLPPTSNLNIDTPGETIANMAIVPIGPDGSITVYTSTSTHVILDLMGWWSRHPGSGVRRALLGRRSEPDPRHATRVPDQLERAKARRWIDHV